jgi:hypothetical protein
MLGSMVGKTVGMTVGMTVGAWVGALVASGLGSLVRLQAHSPVQRARTSATSVIRFIKSSLELMFCYSISRLKENKQEIY